MEFSPQFDLDTATRIKSGSDLYWQVHDFLIDEAAALDGNRLNEWLSMLDAKLDYRVPIRMVKERGAGLRAHTNGFHLLEDYNSIKTKIRRMETDYAWAEDPPSRVRRFVSNLQAFDGEGEALYAVSNLLMIRERLDVAHTFLTSAVRYDTIRDVKGELRLLSRWAILDHAVLETHNLSQFL